MTATAANAIAVSMVLSRLDDCNSCLWAILSQQPRRLQLDKTAAKIITSTWKRKHITSVLKELHWLPMRQRIGHKTMSLAYKCYEDPALEYLQELIPR